ncbi:MAG: hypothetical protein H6740_15110 [Alphaproteobacteria bacterium]|nr:hypothetical protein [Alphaproteobacteria bacterium]
MNVALPVGLHSLLLPPVVTTPGSRTRWSGLREWVQTADAIAKRTLRVRDRQLVEHLLALSPEVIHASLEPQRLIHAIHRAHRISQGLPKKHARKKEVLDHVQRLQYAAVYQRLDDLRHTPGPRWWGLTHLARVARMLRATLGPQAEALPAFLDHHGEGLLAQIVEVLRGRVRPRVMRRAHSRAEAFELLAQDPVDGVALDPELLAREDAQERLAKGVLRTFTLPLDDLVAPEVQALLRQGRCRMLLDDGRPSSATPLSWDAGRLAPISADRHRAVLAARVAPLLGSRLRLLIPDVPGNTILSKVRFGGNRDAIAPVVHRGGGLLLHVRDFEPWDYLLQAVRHLDLPIRGVAADVGHVSLPAIGELLSAIKPEELHVFGVEPGAQPPETTQALAELVREASPGTTLSVDPGPRGGS